MTEASWPKMLLELLQAVDYGDARATQETRAHSALFGDWCERLLVLSGVPARLRLPLIDLARLSHARISLSAVTKRHPLRDALSQCSLEDIEGLARLLASGSSWEEKLPRIVGLARGLADLDSAPSNDGLPPLWQRTVIRLDGGITLSAVEGPDNCRTAIKLSKLIEDSRLEIRFERDVFSPLRELAYGAEVAAISHFDPHGLAALAPTVRSLRGLGLDVHVVSSYESTGDYSRLWKSVIKKLYDDPEIVALILLDLSIDSRHPERSREFAELANEGDKPVIWIDHHRETILEARRLAGRRVTLHLTSVLGTTFAAGIMRTEADILALGALGDKDPYALWAVSKWKEKGRLGKLEEAIAGVNAALDAVIPPHRIVRKALKKKLIEPFSAVRERIINVDLDYLASLGRTASNRSLSLSDIATLPDSAVEEVPELQEIWDTPASSSLSGPESGGEVDAKGKWELRGRVIVFSEKPKTPGRFWYEILEGAMMTAGIGKSGSPVAPYAVASRKLEGGIVNFLFLTHFRAPLVPDVRLYLPRRYQAKWVGHSRAFWLDLSGGAEKRLLPLVVRRINAFLDKVFPIEK